MTLPRVMCEMNYVKKVLKIHSEKKPLNTDKDTRTAHCDQYHSPDQNLVQAASHQWKDAWRCVGVYGEAPLKRCQLLGKLPGQIYITDESDKG